MCTPACASLRAIVTLAVEGTLALWPWLSSRGMPRGVPPMPRESGDTLSDSSAEIVHASMSMVPEAEWECCGMFCGGSCDALVWGGGDSGGGGTALYFPIAMMD